MKARHILIITVGLIFLSLPQASASVVGYVNQPLFPGDNLINNPLDDGTLLLSNVIPTAPHLTTVSLWNPLTEGYDVTSTFFFGSWTADLTLSVGTGALLNTPAPFTNTWVGTVLHGNSTVWNGISPIDPPPVFSGPDGTYLLGTITPLAPPNLLGEDVFLWVLGRAPNVGEKVTTLDPSTQIYTETTYLGSSTWSHGAPELGNAESAFFTIPEPSSIAMIGLVGGFGMFIRRRFMP